MTTIIVSSAMTSTVTLGSGDVMSVLAGGTSLDSVIGSGGIEYVLSSGLSEADVVGSGGLLTVSSGGSADSASIESGGDMVVSGGATNVSVASGATLDVEGGGVVTGIDFAAGATLILQGDGAGGLGGTVESFTVSSGLSINAYANAHVYDAVVLAGGSISVDDTTGALTSNITLAGGLETVVDGSAEATTVRAGGELLLTSFHSIRPREVFSGSGLGTVVSSGGLEMIAGGVAVDTIVSSGGEELVRTGVASGTTVLSGGIFSGNIGYGVVVSSGGLAHMVDGAVTSGVLDFGQTQTATGVVNGIEVKSGGTFELSTVSAVGSGATLYLASGQLLTGGLLVVDSGGVTEGSGAIANGQYDYGIAVYGVLSGVQIGAGSNGDYVSVYAGGAADGVRVFGGEITVFSGGATSGTILSGRAVYEDVSSGASVTGTQLFSGGYQYLVVHASETGASILSGGYQYVSSGASATSDTVSSGGVEVFVRGATLVSGVVLSGGAVERANVTVVSGETVASEEATSAIVDSGMSVSSGGAIGFYNLTIANGGTLIVHAGGRSDDLDVASGSVLEGSGEVGGYIYDAGGLISGVDVVGSDPTHAYQAEGLIESSGKLVGVRVGGDGGYGYVYVGTVASDVRLSHGLVSVGDGTHSATISGAYVYGGEILVNADAIASAIYVSSGGELVLSGGTASGAVIHAGGLLLGSGLVSGALDGLVVDEGVVTAATVVAGGALNVLDHGSAGLVQANSGAMISIFSGGAGDDDTTVFGGILVDDGLAAYSVTETLGGALSGSGVVIQSGKGTLVQSGDASGFSGQAVISGGIIKLSTASDLGTASIAFEATGSATARLEFTTPSQPANGHTFAETLVDFGAASDSLDLTKAGFVSGATATLGGGVLVLVDGAYTASFTLGGVTASGYTVASDGHGGTLITAAASGPLAAKASAALAQALATFAPGDAHLGSLVSADGIASPDYVLAPPATMSRGG